jgi:hypothetical protein
VEAGDTPVLVHNCGTGVRQDIIDETTDHANQFVNRTSKKFSATLQSGKTITMDEAEATGSAFVGEGATEVGPRVFMSADKLRRFRMDADSVAGGYWPFVPHVHLEVLDSAGKALANNHIPLGS